MQDPTFVDRSRGTLLSLKLLGILGEINGGRIVEAITRLTTLSDQALAGKLDAALLNVDSFVPAPVQPIKPARPTEQLANPRTQLQEFIITECRSNFDNFIGAIAALGWFDNFAMWESWHDIPEVDASRAYKARSLIKKTLQQMAEAGLDSDSDNE